MNYFSEKIITILKNNILDFSETEIREIYQIFASGGIKKIETNSVNSLFRNFLGAAQVSKK